MVQWPESSSISHKDPFKVGILAVWESWGYIMFCCSSVMIDFHFCMGHEKGRSVQDLQRVFWCGYYWWGWGFPATTTALSTQAMGPLCYWAKLGRLSAAVSSQACSQEPPTWVLVLSVGCLLGLPSPLELGEWGVHSASTGGRPYLELHISCLNSLGLFGVVGDV